MKKNENYNGAIYSVTDEWKANHYRTCEIANPTEDDASVGTIAVCPLYGKHCCYPTCMYHIVTADDAEECYCIYSKRGSDCFK